MILEPRVLEGTYVRLEPAAEAHRQDMGDALNCDLETWQIQMASGMGAHFPAYWDAMLATEGRIPFAVRDRANRRLAGTSSFLFVDPRNRTLEIGSTWFRPEYRGTRINPESKLLMLAEAFGAGALRVQFGIDSRNARSQAACRKLGAREEGVLRRHRITWTGHKRDTILFSIIDKEWPEVKARLEERLAGA
ncbi:GNAT family N-acetyltransferase [Sphingosinicella rhizophila]|uniref:GNAT family protein n=1 Tax=Sphingosinicella rhizophila TaxID=3050082 RepID=A0ABU3Q781_9SPHN|nr:GNAT family protein [Sphingosinicella sp. GR2756]MDT9599258.1 GNAT family protein [Sphingosinicella sp. GR2756]